jgi:hypothetical protein
LSKKKEPRALPSVGLLEDNPLKDFSDRFKAQIPLEFKTFRFDNELYHTPKIQNVRNIPNVLYLFFIYFY